MTIGALVLGGDYRGLGIVRSLGRRAIPVFVVSDGDHLVATVSRYNRCSLTMPAGDEDAQIDYLLRIREDHGLDGWVVFPTSDASAILLARHHSILQERFRLTTPPWEVVRWAHDKRLTHQLAMQSHVDYPWTKYPRDHEEVAAIECQYPVILKPAKREKINRFTDDKAWRVDNQNELLARYEEACQYVPADQIMVQDFVPGSGETQFAFAALCDEGRTIACLTAQRRRQYPAEFGRASTYVVTLDEPKVEDSARRILSRMRYSGIVEVEFKLDERDGRYKLLDINTRAWGWHTIGKAAGIDYPHLLWRMVQGEIISPVRAQAGVRWAYMLPNALVAAQEIWQGKLSPVAFLWSLRPPLQSALFAADDPAPSLLEFPLLLHRLWKRRRRIAAIQQGSMLSNQVPAELSSLSSKATTRSAEGLTR